MHSRIAPLIGVVVCLLTAFASAQEPTSNPKEASARGQVPKYLLAPGSRLEFETSGTFTNIRDGGEEVVRHRTSYTVLNKEKDTLDIFMSIERVEPPAKNKAAAFGPRDTIQITEQGEIVKRGTLAPTQLFPGWTVNAELVRLFTESKDGTLNYLDPTSGVELPAKLETKLSNGIYHQRISYSANDDKQDQASPLKIRSLVVEAEFSTTEGAPLSFKQDFQAEIVDPRSQETKKLHARVESRRIGMSKLSSEELAKLREDAAAGASAARAMRESIAGNELDTTKLLTTLDEYLAKHPKGEFAGMFQAIADEVRSSEQRTRNWQAIAVGKTAPDFEAGTIDGKKVRLSDLKGKVVLLDFWATWCGPCRMIMPEMKKLYEENKEKDFVMIGISGDETLEDLKTYVEKEGIAWAQIFEPGQETTSVLHRYGISKFPTTVVIDKNGVIAAVDEHPPKLNETVKKLIEQK
ncbi:MAG: TlpA family protein disulfide reductase [Candidatus Hydrogenedentota bacterium]|jgi:peroxiredoxin|nr:MAG: TlpA family protein disulfide reductase [Candidatus Hydrogenedentota bacterium]